MNPSRQDVRGDARRVLLLLHPMRREALDLGREVARRLIAAGIEVIVPTEDEVAGPLHDVHGLSLIHI